MSLKIRPEHLEHLRAAITPLDRPIPRKMYFKAGQSDMRYRWDLLYRAGLSKWICDHLYAYLDDTHIDSALRHLVRPLSASDLNLAHTPA